VGLGPRVRGWAAAFGGDEEAHYRRRWRAPHVVVRLFRTRRPMTKEYDSWARAPVSEAGPLLSRR
jgi:predicted alpha/beta hydrolase family esterase